MDDWRIGDIRVTRILEMCDPLRTPSEWFPDCTDEALEPHLHWLTPRLISPATGRLIFPIQSFLVRTGRHTILVDGCVGNDKTCAYFPHWHRRNDGAFLERLANAGVAPEQIDYVLCTHLHIDHCGWNTRLVDGRWPAGTLAKECSWCRCRCRRVVPVGDRWQHLIGRRSFTKRLCA